jgi:hypothetical protein
MIYALDGFMAYINPKIIQNIILTKYDICELKDNKVALYLGLERKLFSKYDSIIVSFHC